MNTKLGKLKALLPILTLTTVASANAGVDCTDHEQTEISFWQPTGDKNAIIVINHLRTNEVEQWGGTYNIIGQGQVSKTAFNVMVTSTYTGTHENIKMGKLKGEKVNGSWRVEFTPAEPITGKLITSDKRKLTCSDNY